MRLLASLSLLLLAACGSGGAPAVTAPTSLPPPVAPTTVDPADYGYKGSATFEAPSGSDDFVALGADPTGATDSLPVLLDWFANDGESLYIPEGTYLLTMTGNLGGIVTSRSFSIVGAGEELVTLKMGPDAISSSCSLVSIQGACDVTLQGFHVEGPALTAPFYYEQLMTSVVFGNTVTSTTETNVTVDHVTWDKITNAFAFFGGSTTPTTLSISNFVSECYVGGISFYRDYVNDHWVNLSHGSFLAYGVKASDNPYGNGDRGTAVYIHGAINYNLTDVYFQSEGDGTFSSFKCGGGQDQTRGITKQYMDSCYVDTAGGFAMFDGWVPATVERSMFMNAPEGTSHLLGGNGVTFVECGFDVEAVLMGGSGNKTYGFVDCTFHKIGLRVAENGIRLYVVGGSTLYPEASQSPGWFLRMDQNTTSEVFIGSHTFTSEITTWDGATTTLLVEGGTLRLSNVTFAGQWRNGADAAPLSITSSSNVQKVTMRDCTWDMGERWGIAIDGPHGRDVLFTTNTHLNGARVSDPYEELQGD